MHQRDGITSMADLETEPSISDAELMSQVAQCDQRAFTTLVQRHQKGLMNFFYHMGDYNHADDLAQKTFLRLFNYRDKYRPKAKFTTFLYVLARRTWIDHCRALTRRKNMHATLTTELEVQKQKGSLTIEESRARAEYALSQLSDEMRIVIVMSIYQGFKYREIAEVLGIPLGTVKTRVFNALKKCRKTLATDGEL
jgi:RNA polymerase sigma-70 factor (ECF subfamily)